jgi:hypothetical protein
MLNPESGRFIDRLKVAIAVLADATNVQTGVRRLALASQQLIQGGDDFVAILL